MKQFQAIEKPRFCIPTLTPGKTDYTAQAHASDMYAVHLFKQISPSFGLPFTYTLNSFYQKKQPHGKTGSKQKEQGQQLLDELMQQFTDALTQAGWTYYLLISRLL